MIKPLEMKLYRKNVFLDQIKYVRIEDEILIT